MDARWYSPSIGRFMSEDTYMGDINISQSINRYAYVMNNPVNMWDPTGHVPSWVGEDVYYTTMPDNTSIEDLYILKENTSSSSGWYLIDKITTSTQITYKYKATITMTWVYDHYDFTSEDNEYVQTTKTFSETYYHYNDIVISAQEIAQENEKYIKDLAGDPPKNSDTPAVKIRTLQVGSGPVELLNPDQIIVQNTGKKTTGPQSLVAGAVQSELNRAFNEDLKVDGWYGSGTAGAVADFQKSVGLTANGKLDVKTFYQLEQNKKLNDLVLITKGTGLTDNLPYKPKTSAQMDASETTINDAAYIFYLPEWKNEAKDDKKRLTDYYGLDEDMIILSAVTSTDELTEIWNSMGTIEGNEVNISTVIINTHASAEALSFGNGNRMSVSDISNLEEKSIDKLILYGCNAGHLDHAEDNPAAEFAKIVNGTPVLARDGTVYSSRSILWLFGEYKYKSKNDKTFKNQSTIDNKRDNEAWIIYKYTDGNINTSESIGENFSLNNMIKKIE